MTALARHFNAFRFALKEDKARAASALRVEETAFLPAALELVERPVSPTARLTAQLMLAGMVALVAWLALGRIDIVATAQGKVVPAANVKLIQPAAPGIVRRILVRDGDFVRAGQPLVELDPTEADADAASARKALQTAELEAARSRAVLSALDGHGLSFAAPAGVDPALAADQRALAWAQYNQIVAEASVSASEARAAGAAVAEARQQARKLAETLPLLDQQIAANETLLAKGYVSKLKVIEMRRTRMAAARDRDIALSTAAKASAQRASAAGGVARSKAASRAAVLTALTQAEAEARLRREELVKAGERAGRTVLTAPVSGRIAQLSVHTEGGVVESTKPIMLVVPDKGGLAIEAKILSRDMGFVKPGQTVEVKLDAFPFTRYGFVTGRIERIGADAVEDEKMGLVYTARIVLDRASIDRGDARVPLTPGMGAQVDVQTGSRTMLDYLLSPIDKARLEAARER